jgi:hypothetical protein
MEITPLNANVWPELRWQDWSATADTLHMWTQIVGKVRLALSPLQAHWWNVPLYVSARGLSTSAMPYGPNFLEIEFDFVNHQLLFRTSTGLSAYQPLRAQSVADFYIEFQKTLSDLGVHVHIYATPVELAHPIPFAEDTEHHTYDPDADPITREAYSHEVISAGFWPGNGGYGKAAFYCYAAPSPANLDTSTIQPSSAFWDRTLGEFILPYENLRTSGSPDDTLLAFLQSTYEAAADLAHWDRPALERPAV